MIVKVTQSIDDRVEPYQHAEQDKSMTDPAGLQREYYEYDYGDICSLSYICPGHQNLVISFDDNFFRVLAKKNC